MPYHHRVRWRPVRLLLVIVMFSTLLLGFTPPIMSSHAAPVAAPVAQTAPPPPAPQLAAEALSTAVLVPYVGQIPEPAHALAYLPHATVALQDGGMLMQLADMQLPITWRNAHPAPSVALHTRLAGVLHVVDGATAQQRRDLSRYGGATYHSLYHYIDLDLTLVGDRLKSTWHVAPGGDPTQISWAYPVSLTLALAPGGELVVAQPDGTAVLSETAPLAWQDTASGRVDVPVTYAISGTTVQFQLGSYDPTLPLVIDPEFVPSSLDYDGAAVAVDSANTVYIGYGSMVQQQDGWSVQLSNDSTTQVVDLVVSGSETLYVLLRQDTPWEATLLLQTLTTDGGVQSATTIATAAGIRNPALALLPDATPVLIWSQRSSSGTALADFTCMLWNDTRLLATIPGGPCASIAADRTGSIYTVQYDSTAGTVWKFAGSGDPVARPTSTGSAWTSVIGAGVVSVDSGNNVYVAATDGTSTRIDSWTAAGTLRWTHSLGSINGATIMSVTDSAVDVSGRMVLVGSASVPQQDGSQGMIARISPDGQTLEYGLAYTYATLDTTISAVAVDTLGNAFVIGYGSADSSGGTNGFFGNVYRPIIPEEGDLPPYPGYTESIYQTQTSVTDHTQQGCYTRSRDVDGILFLNYGSPRGGPASPSDFGNGEYGAGWFSTQSKWFTLASIEEAVRYFILGYMNIENICSNYNYSISSSQDKHLIIAVSLSNSYHSGAANKSITPDHAHAWAAMIDRLSSFIVSNADLNQNIVSVAAGLGAEPNFENSYEGQPPTVDWITAYNSYQVQKSEAVSLLYFFGSTDGGPRYGPPNKNWTTTHLAKLELLYSWTYQNQYVRLIPQMYNIAYVHEWFQFQRYAFREKGRLAHKFYGVMTQCLTDGSNDPNSVTNCNVNTPTSWTTVWPEPCQTDDYPPFSPEQGWRATYDTFHRTLATTHTISRSIFLADNLVLLSDVEVNTAESSEIEYYTTSNPYDNSISCLIIPNTDLAGLYLPNGTILSANITIPSLIVASDFEFTSTTHQPLLWSTNIRWDVYLFN